MKNALLSLAVVSFCSTASAQDVCPEFVNQVSALSADGTKAVPLELERAVAKQKKKGIYRGFDNSVRLDGEVAKVAVTSTDAFVFRPLNPQIQPAQQIQLYLFKGAKKYRELVVGGVNVFGGSKNRKSGDQGIPLSFEKIKDGCYKVKPATPLPKGQYGFSLAAQGASVTGTSAGYGTTTQGQTWFGFSVK